MKKHNKPTGSRTLQSADHSYLTQAALTAVTLLYTLYA